MVHHLLLLYPNNEGITFDETYYLKTHMPFVEKTWEKYGLLGWKTTKYPLGLDGSRSPYLISTQVEFEDEDALAKALEDPDVPKIFEDVPNYTNVTPITLGGSQISD